MKKNEKSKIIPLSNYFIVFAVSILIIVVAIIARSFYINYKLNNIKSSVFNESVNQINISDIDYALNETSEVILYVGYDNDSVRDMETKLYKEIESSKLLDKIIYLDVSEFRSNNEYLTILKEKFAPIKDEITNAPMLVYIKNGIGIEAMSSELKMIDDKVFNKLVNKYGIE